MKRMRRNAQRGQAVVELAITSVMFVVVLLFGVYFAEVGYLSQKVQEAAAYAMYDTTRQRVSDFDEQNLTGRFNAVYRPFNSLNGWKDSKRQANENYEDFDGVLTDGQTIQQVMTAADRLQVDCQPERAMSFDIPNVTSPRALFDVMPILDNLYKDRGGLSCSAQANVRAVNFPTSFLDRDGPLSKEQLHDGAPLKVCGVGRAVNGRCRGSYAILTGDWALDQADMSDRTTRIDNRSKQDRMGRPSGTNKNPGFRKLVREIYENNGDSKQSSAAGLTRAQELIQIGGGYAPDEVRAREWWDDRKFLMSYAGEEDGFADALERTTDPTNPTDSEYNTSGVYIPSWQNRQARQRAVTSLKQKYKNCFLGISREGCANP